MSKLVRNQTIDIAKLICLILMVFCHIYPKPNEDFLQIVYSFHMPFFFFVGGLFYNPKNFNLKKGCKTLIIPYLLFNFFIVILNCVISLSVHTFNFSYIRHSLLGILMGTCRADLNGYLPAVPSWFLLAYFLIKYSSKYILQCNIQLKLTLIILPITCVLFLRNYYTWCPWSIDSAILGSIFFYAAYFLKRYYMTFINSKKMSWLIFLLFPIVCLSWINGQTDMFTCAWGYNFFLYVFFAFVGCINIIIISKHIRMPQAILTTFMNGSIFIICMNMWIIDYTSIVIHKIFNITRDFNSYEKVIITAIVFFITYCCTPVIMKVMPQLLGKGKIQKN